MISTRDLSLLPDIGSLRRLLQSMAMLDAILCPEWQYRYYSFNSRWSTGEQMGSMRDGCGDDFFALFNSAGCWLKGFAHEKSMSPYSDRCKELVWPGVLDSVPAEFAACMQQPAFKISDTTFCIWRRFIDASWMCGQIEFPPDTNDPDGSRELLSPLDGRPESYHSWAESYYERDVKMSAVRVIYDHLPLTGEIINSLNPELVPAMLEADVIEIGYPMNSQA
jgi:hypothetical protein